MRILLTIAQQPDFELKEDRKQILNIFQDNLMNNFNRDIIIALMFITGLWSFVSGQFIVSTLLFGSTTILSNLIFQSKS